MKRLLCATVALLLIFAINTTAFADDNEITSLLDISDAECIDFLKDYNVEIPDLYEDEMDCVPFVRAVIEMLETNGSADVQYECYALMEFANAIEMAVCQFYGSGGATAYIISTSPSILVDNTVHGNWIEEYKTYNCYGYAIEMKEWLLPGLSLWLNQGEPAETYYFNGYASMNTLLNWIEADLEYYGFTVNTISTSCPDVEVSGHTNIICFRKDLDETLMLDKHGLLQYNHDFHFMKLNEDGYWYHKPGATNPLKYKYTPSNDNIWVREGYHYTGEKNEYFRYPEYTYESGIYYIQYTASHEYEYEYCGNGQHFQFCSVCGYTNGSALDCAYKNGSNTCSLCGHFDDYIAINRSKILPLQAE